MTLARSILMTLCPMHVCLDHNGAVTQVGPTLQKLRPETVMTGARFLDLFDVARPRLLKTVDDLMTHAGAKLHLRFRDAPRTGLKGVLVHDGQGGSVVDLSFGISVVDAVRDYDLSASDFSATDLTIEMLYLFEAKSAAMDVSRTLNRRLYSARIAAEEQAFTDTLTGLKNRRAADHVLAQAVASGRDFAVMHLDLDFFKNVNDTLGHAAGDHVLQHVARVLLDETRVEDAAARVGGDEFILIILGQSRERQLSEIADRIIARLETPITFEGRPCKVSASIGIALCAGHAPESVAEIMHRADAALYCSKRRGRARHSFYSPALEGDFPFGADTIRPDTHRQ